MIKIISVVGARPNFMKIAPLHIALDKYKDKITHLVCHTGQHFDAKMSDVFFNELNLPKPHFHLGVGGGSHAEQTAAIMIKFEEVVLKEKPDMIIVPGDVNSTVACSLVAKKLNIKLAHIESGLRSFDRTMPEEINRLITDVISDYLFVSEESGLVNLRKEGIDESKIHFVGNIIIDSIVNNMHKIDKSDITERLNIEKRNYILVTFHRPANVDDKDKLIEIIEFLNKLSLHKKVVFPIHPRTRNNMIKWNIFDTLSSNIIINEPMGYVDFVNLTKNAFLVITDSGGIQEETTFLGVQCITVRENTERPVTVTVGTNQLIGTNLNNVYNAAMLIVNGNIKKGNIPELWDGQTAVRIADFLAKMEF
ncbi:MAG: UDP-N-acetylglucosamine 2-epimerase [Bacteroidetes bacterium GWE2_29_8]|nr:MAG: UDP-N-acetylglucosamine 2-epimerase [Bacteroidetes bacterium GWE2_29_8]